MTNKALIQKFYESFAAGNAAGMIECYHENIVFEDPAFGVLKGEEAKSMWRMLLTRSEQLPDIQFTNIITDDNLGSANWVARYTYGLQKRKVINKISAGFEFLDGKIIRHKDNFDLWIWSQQALGLSGYLLGWSSFMRNKIQQKANRALKKFMQKNS